MAFGCPHVEGVLGEVAGFVLPLAQAERESIQRLVEPLNQLFEIQIVHAGVRFAKCGLFPSESGGLLAGNPTSDGLGWRLAVGGADPERGGKSGGAVLAVR